MNKRRAHILFGVIAGAVLLAFLVLLVFLLSEVRTLRQQIDQLPASLERGLSDSNRGILYGVEDRLSGKLEAGSSLLASQEAVMRYADGRLLVTVTLSPKVLEAGEKVFVRLNGSDRPVPASSDDGFTFTATLESPLQETVIPTVLFANADGGFRQETMERQETDLLLSVDALPFWAGDLYNWPGPAGVFFLCVDPPAGGIGKLELVLKDRETGAEAARFQMEPVTDFPKEQFPEGMAAYCADLGDRRDKTGSYGLWAELTDTGGLLLTDLNEVGGFSNDESGTGDRWNSGSNVLSPAWPKGNG